MKYNIFQSYLMGGFECSTHRYVDGKQVDVITASRHDVFAEKDYQRLLDFGIRTARDGTRWHLIEKTPFQYDWTSVLKQIRAARKTGIQVIWDLFHYGYPHDLDIFSSEFIGRFSAYAENFVKLLLSEGETKPLICLVNEISFFGWAAGEVEMFYPFCRHRGDEIKRQLVKASIVAAAKIKSIAPETILIQTDPVVRVLPLEKHYIEEAKNVHNAQFHALDMLLGRTEPEIGGSENIIDFIGVNYYLQNQWRHPSGERILLGEKDYLPFSEILKSFYERYKKPLFIAETGIEDDLRPEWFRYICEEVRLAEKAGVPIFGICLYPIVNHPGWNDDRHCQNGLWCYADEFGEREIYKPLADEIKRQMNQEKHQTAF